MGKTTIKLCDTFLYPRQELGRSSTIPASLARCEETGRLKAFTLQWKAGDPDQPHIYWDSDVAKVLEGMAYTSALFQDKDLEKQLDELVALVLSAQQPDGYLNTHFTVVEPENRWKNLFDWHELYCAGHLIEAAVARYEYLGKRDFLDAMCKYADLIWNVFGPDGKPGYPGHEELELALIKLYRATGNKKYLDLSNLFIERRGTEPNYYLQEDSPDVSYRDLRNRQAHIPVRQQHEATGHAVRAVYLYAGMADAAFENGDTELMDLCDELFDDITTRKMYITGGIGCRIPGEGLGSAYELPLNRAYAESCAAMGLVQFAARLLKYRGNVKYADAIERLICNGAISGLSLSGDRFFYANPHACDKEFRSLFHWARTRQPWHNTSCCPTSYCRFLPQLGNFCYRAETNDLYIDIAASAEIETEQYKVKITSGWPWNGNVMIEVIRGSVNLHIRIPDWCNGNYEISGTGSEQKRYWHSKDAVSAGEKIKIDFELKTTLLYPDCRIPSTRGKAAIRRGPMIYCVESPDCDGFAPGELSIPANSTWQESGCDALPEGTVVLTGEGFAELPGKELYSTEPPEFRPVTYRAIPYALWQNRGNAEMEIFFTLK